MRVSTIIHGIGLLVATALLSLPADARVAGPCESLLLASKADLPAAIPTDPEGREAYVRLLRERFGIRTGKLTWGRELPIIIKGGGEKSYMPPADFDHAEPDLTAYDSIIIGSGPAGLTAGVYLTEAGQRVLLLERDEKLGGLGQGGDEKTAGYARGGAYIAGIDGIDYKIYKHLGLGNYKSELPIPEPIDSFDWNGQYYEGLWEPETLARLPASFELFKYYLLKAGRRHQITNQPMEEDPATFELDRLSMADWVRTFPARMSELAWRDAEARRIYRRFLADPKVNRADPMKDVIGLLDLYGRSAMGDHADKISAAGFANFYLSELDTRYAGAFGTGTITDLIKKRLDRHADLVTIKTGTPAARVVDTADGADVYYLRDGKTYRAHARSVIFGASLNVGARLIDDFQKLAPEHYAAIKSLSFRHYLVIDVHLRGQAWRRTYDLWVRNDGEYSQSEFTDVIDGRWVEFNGSRTPRADDHGVLTIYQPLPESFNSEPLTDEKVAEIAERAVDKLRATIDPINERLGDGQKLEPLLVEANRWLYSIHIVEPGHFTKALELRKPVGHIHFADNNIGVPAVEEAVYRGYRAAQEVLKTRAESR